SLQWESIDTVINTIDVLMNTYEIGVVKTGIVPSFEFLLRVVNFIKAKKQNVKFVVDPVITASSGFTFQNDIQAAALEQLLGRIYLLTPNTPEAIALTGLSDANEAALALSAHCHVLLKGGHASEKTGVDVLYANGKTVEFMPSVTDVFPKHGSGCILSAAIAANLALGFSPEAACEEAKRYTEQVLMSNSSLLAYHV
ncbi:MAG: bifunctional hydroxymethylpyrimidine kinase/phosphomethylpyrimidine kinase, partial [Bacteroidia bacterium]